MEPVKTTQVKPGSKNNLSNKLEFNTKIHTDNTSDNTSEFWTNIPLFNTINYTDHPTRLIRARNGKIPQHTKTQSTKQNIRNTGQKIVKSFNWAKNRAKNETRKIFK